MSAWLGRVHNSPPSTLDGETLQLEGYEPTDMCEVLDRVEARGIAIGAIEGAKIGREKAKKEDALNMRSQLNITDPATIARVLNLPTELVEHWFEEAPV